MLALIRLITAKNSTSAVEKVRQRAACLIQTVSTKARLIPSRRDQPCGLRRTPDRGATIFRTLASTSSAASTSYVRAAGLL